MKTNETRKATHNGTCQVCGRLQKLPGALMSKHGYTVDWGFFNGTCRGSDNQPLEVSKDITEATIKHLREVVAPNAERLAADLRAGVVFPKWRKYMGGKEVEVKREELDEYTQSQCVAGAAIRAQQNANHARSHASALERLIVERHGKPLIQVVEDDRVELAAGVRVQIGGKKGKVYEIAEMKHQVTQGCGPYLNGQVLLHAVLRREDGRVFAVPARTIRQSAIQK